MKAGLWFISLLTIFLIGCAKSYVPPTSGPTATLYFDQNSGFTSINHQNKCGTEQPADWHQDHIVRADEPLWIHQGIYTIGLQYGIDCLYRYTFTPKAGFHYIGTYVLYPASCSLEMIEISPEGEKTDITLQLETFEPDSCWW